MKSSYFVVKDIEDLYKMRSSIVGPKGMPENLLKSSGLMDKLVLRTEKFEKPHLWIIYSKEGPSQEIVMDSLKLNDKAK